MQHGDLINPIQKALLKTNYVYFIEVPHMFAAEVLA